MILSVSQLSKKFGQVTAVDAINFSLKQGEILGFLGPNGAGKTTTISMLLGLLTPSSGSIEIFGFDQKKNHEQIMQKTGYSSAYIRAPWRLKVIEHLLVFARIYHVENYKQAAEEMLTTFSLTEERDKFAGDLSAGNMAKLNLAKAFIHKPDLVLLDEPTSSLDPEIACEVRKFLMQVQTERGTSIILTSHNMSEVEELADRVIFMHKGKIIAEDAPENLSKKSNQGSMTLIIQDGMKRLIALLDNKKYAYTQSLRSITISLKLLAIPDLLSQITTNGIIYSDIFIERPTLEDYFISLLGSFKNEKI